MTTEISMSRKLRPQVLIGGLVTLAVLPVDGGAQQAEPLAALIAEARANNPEIEAAHRQVAAMAARVPQAGALPDPMLAAGFMYVPVPGFDLAQDGMTMASVQIGQRLPAPGARGAREAIARQNSHAAARESDEVELGVVTRLKSAYYELLFVDRALDVLTRNRSLVVDLAEVARARFAVGRTP
jgi:outer membrane protein, heavy metal efflux system